MVATLTRHFARKPAGQKQRSAAPAGAWERVTNLQQRALVRAYDDWSARVRKELSNAIKRGASPPDRYAIFKDSLTRLEASLAEVSVRGAVRAGRVAAGKRFDTPVVQKAVQAEADIARRLVAESLVPNIEAHLLPAVVAGFVLSDEALKTSFEPGRAMAAQYAGGAWVAIFKVQQEAGKELERERISAGLPVEPVRWVLDPAAEHCAHGADGFFGCPEMAGEYAGGWSTLPTVPAGRVSCRGNCRCRLEVFRNGEWRRGLFDE